MALVMAGALAAGLAACGSDDDGGGGDDAAAKGGSATVPSLSGSVKEQVAAAVRATEDAYRTGDGEAYCASLTAAGQKEVADYARFVGQDPSCEEFIKDASRKVRELGITQKRSRVVSVRSTGSRARAMISIDGKPPRPTVFVKSDGRWKFKTAGITSALN